MAKRKTKTSSPEVEVAKETQTVVVFKATKPLTQTQHEALSERLRYENRESGLRIVLTPCTVDGIEVEEVVAE